MLGRVPVLESAVNRLFTSPKNGVLGYRFAAKYVKYSSQIVPYVRHLGSENTIFATTPKQGHALESGLTLRDFLLINQDPIKNRGGWGDHRTHTTVFCHRQLY
jgi:hypothetical protein